MKEKFLKIGLTSTEVDIYMALLEHTRLSPASIGKITGVNRSTVYAACSELLKKNIIEEDLSGKTKYYVSLPPERLKNYTNKQLREIRMQENIIEELVPELELIPKSTNYSIPRVQVVNGDDVESFLYQKTPMWEKSMRDLNEKTWWGFQDHAFVEIEKYRKWILWYWNQVKEDIDLKLFTNQSEIEEEMKEKKIEKRKLKLWRGDQFASTQWILGEYVVSIITRGKFHYLVQIRDRVLADSMRNLAKNLWKRD
ncbi:MAG TPA: helix-turn-helix domain-containing protein [Candidatus Paceibacterota bacterium]|nr:helix-turn-helix domain-containing protein [Candidatus Paceibacterota bacterium]